MPKFNVCDIIIYKRNILFIISISTNYYYLNTSTSYYYNNTTINFNFYSPIEQMDNDGLLLTDIFKGINE